MQSITQSSHIQFSYILLLMSFYKKHAMNLLKLMISLIINTNNITTTEKYISIRDRRRLMFH